jgi:hypothetical protein
MSPTCLDCYSEQATHEVTHKGSGHTFFLCDACFHSDQAAVTDGKRLGPTERSSNRQAAPTEDLTEEKDMRSPHEYTSAPSPSTILIKLSDGAYQLIDGRARFHIGNITVSVYATDEGVVCDLHGVGRSQESLASTYALFTEAEAPEAT